MRTLAIRVATGTLLSAAVAATLVVPGLAQEPDWKAISFKSTKLGTNLYMIEGVGGFSGGNIAVAVAPDGVLLVDASMPPLSDKLRAAVKAISDQPIKAVINTHVHGDHSMGNMAFGKDALIIAHQRTRERLMKDGFDEQGKASPASLPDLTIEDKLRLFWGEEEVRAATAPPAHTDSDVTVHFVNQNVVHMGDLFFNGLYPFIDVSKGGSVKGYTAAVKKALRELPPNAKIIPGHGPLASKKDLETYLAMLEDTQQIIEKGIAAGKSVDDLKKAKVFAKYDATLGKGFFTSDQHIEALYEGLKKK